MTLEKLISMANQIAAFFRPYPAEEAAASVKHHLEAFWTPTMVAMLQAHAGAGGAGLDGLVIKAFEEPAGPSLVERAAEPLHEGGQMATDAG